MRFDLSFHAWVLTRRLPLFALIAALAFTICNALITPKTENYIATAELAFAQHALATDILQLDPKTRYEFVRFRMMTSDTLEKAAQTVGFDADPRGQTVIRYQTETNEVTIGFRSENPEVAVDMARMLTTLFATTAQTLYQLELERQASRYDAELKKAKIGSAAINVNQVSIRNSDLYTQSLVRLQATQTRLQQHDKPIIISTKPVAITGYTPQSTASAVYLILMLFAVSCGAAAIWIAERLDTVIRRPHDLEHAIGLSTFGVIPDLKFRPAQFNN
ncbi:MAG: hypothetical protein ABJ327_16595 [Litoreibacter sp.]